MDRRTFLACASTGLVASQALAATDRKRRVAVIGHSGRGNYGHGLDVVWQKLANTEIVGVADPDESGLRNAEARLKVENGFADYRTMLKELRPEFVSVAPRHPE